MEHHHQRLPSWGRTYVSAVVVLGGATILYSAYQLHSRPIGWNWFILALLTLLSGSATVKLPSVPATISISETFVFTSVLLFGPAAGTLTVTLDVLAISWWLTRRGHPFYRIAFNVFALPASLWVGGHLFYWLSGIQPLALSSQPVQISTLLIPLIAFTLAYFLLNSWLIAVAISFETKASPQTIWRNNFAWLSLNYFGGASIAALLVTYTRNLDYTYVAFVLPLLAILYFTFSMAMGRVEDANNHLSQLNSLYMSTIETLAMAIDAKDQITHGHIRRVQIFAVALAKAMGVTESAQIKAVEAAALLHDMGKLAVPEYILNKPGPLTAAEFEKMKLHASVGADILSAIEFPYPVVPIVRHHHENWDGTGYPDGLKGSDIPIGARILSVVDCFDALTSDRPYRPRLSDADALRILSERRGRMYDPLVIDTFASVYKEIVGSVQEVHIPTSGLSAITRGVLPHIDYSMASASRLDDISASTEEMLLLYELARSLSGRLDLGDAADVISKHLRRLVPATTCVFFLYETDSDELVAAHASGENSSHFSDIRIAMGQRLSGWVAANRQTIVNSDPMLDLGEIARALKPPLRSCLSTPLMVSEDLVGVLTVYSTHRDAFTEDHRRLVEVVARQVSQTVRQSVEFSRDNTEKLRDQLTGLPNRQHLERFVASELSASGGLPCSILLVEVRHSNEKSTQRLGQPVIGQVAKAMRAGLRGADLLFRYDSDRLVALLTQTDALTAEAVGRRVSHELALARLADEEGASPAVHIGRATASEDGAALSDLIQVAESRPLPPPPTIRQSIH
jgi:diguanylate cyclase (GGDEF)-like protein/putative nucleotidyltransferase with HDIG domain